MTIDHSPSDPNSKTVRLNRSQAMVNLINANITIAAWPRGQGKTSIIGSRILHLSEAMPRAQVLLISDTFERLEEVTIPGLENFLKIELALAPGVDYVMHAKPPDHWLTPYFVPVDYDHVISFASGFALCEVSMKKQGSAAGFNAQAGIGDEWKYVDAKRFNAEVRPAIRGAKNTVAKKLHDGRILKWYDIPEFQSLWLFTDKFPTKGSDLNWVLDQRKKVNQGYVDIIYTLQLECIKLEQQIEELSSNDAKYKRIRMIREYEEVMRKLRMDLVYYSDALPYENIENLGDRYFRDQKRDLTKYEYEVAIENKDPDKAITPFYPALDRKHFYQHNNDYNPNKPLIIALDYQFSITPIPICQFDRLPGCPFISLNFIQSVHSLQGEGGMDAALNKFCEAYIDHPAKVVFYIFDHTAIGRSPYGKSFKDHVCNFLINKGWSVIEIYTGDAPYHDIKYLAIDKWLKWQSDGQIRINELRNESMKTSIEMTGAMNVMGKTKKDKSSEKQNSKTPPEKATHYSDAFDQIVWGGLELQLVPMIDDVGMDIVMR